MTQIALLRGVNVGGKNKLPMSDLAGMFVEAGCENVRTFIQSGNVFFEASPRVTAKLAIRIADMILERFGYRTPVILRSAAELRDVIANNPFLRAGAPEDILHVMFLSEAPNSAATAGLDPNRSAPDAFEIRGREIYLQLPNGVAGTKLSNAWFDSKLKTTSTQRNWKTVTKLLAMMEE